jgi:hypothetical protein
MTQGGIMLQYPQHFAVVTISTLGLRPADRVQE